MALSGVAVGGIIALSVVVLALLKRYFNGGKNIYYPDLTGKIVVITGANTGLGFISAREMAKLNAKHIILACRSEQRGTDAVNKIKKDCKVDNIEFMQLDLNDLSSVQTFAANFNAKFDKIDILLNNAGIMALPTRETTAQGFEKQFGVNHVGHFLLTKLLLNKVKASPEGRIVNLSSLAHETGKMNFDDIQHEKEYVPWPVYSQSKLSNILFTRGLDDQLNREGATHVKTVACHPGVVRTELGRYMFEGQKCKQVMFMLFGAPFFYLMTKTPWWGT